MTAGMRVVSRSEWRAEAPVWSTLLELPVSQVFFTMTRTWPCTHHVTCADECRRLQHGHRMTRGDIRYNFLIGGDGLVYEGRGWLSTPSLEHGYTDQEDTSIYIACIGKNKSPGKDILFKLLHEFVEMGVEMKYITEEYNLQFIDTSL